MLVLKHFISKRLEYVNMMAESCAPVGTPRHARIQADCVEGILQAVRGAKSIPADSVFEIKTLLEANLENLICATILSAMDTRVNLASTTPTGSPHQGDKQQHFFIDAYLTQRSWDIFESSKEQTPRNQKLYHMATVLRKVDIYNGSEKMYSL
jgi:hypothetical protein